MGKLARMRQIAAFISSSVSHLVLSIREIISAVAGAEKLPVRLRLPEGPAKSVRPYELSWSFLPGGSSALFKSWYAPLSPRTTTISSQFSSTQMALSFAIASALESAVHGPLVSPFASCCLPLEILFRNRS